MEGSVPARQTVAVTFAVFASFLVSSHLKHDRSSRRNPSKTSPQLLHMAKNFRRRLKKNAQASPSPHKPLAPGGQHPLLSSENAFQVTVRQSMKTKKRFPNSRDLDSRMGFKVVFLGEGEETTAVGCTPRRAVPNGLPAMKYLQHRAAHFSYPSNMRSWYCPKSRRCGNCGRMDFHHERAGRSLNEVNYRMWVTCACICTSS